MTTTVEFSVEVDATPEDVWTVASDPRNLPQWDRHIEWVDLPAGGLRVGARYRVSLRFIAVRTTVSATVIEWEPPWRSVVRLEGMLEATVSTSIASLPYERSVLRHEVSYRFRGPLGGVGARSLQAVGGAQHALKRGVLAQKRQIEAAT
jgi:uncharacterized protein YndB with AHSA1/START domain